VLNNDAWFLFENSCDRSALESALTWSKKVIEKEPTANYYDTYANLLYKLGRAAEAIEMEEKALTLDQGNGSIDDVKKALEKMRAGLPTWPEKK
jgi:tetratricopeptide (TPR) repeat protein